MGTRGSTARPALDDTSVPVVVLKLARNPVHHGAVGIVRSLGRLGVEVHTVRQSRWEPIRLSRYDAGGFVCDHVALDDEEIVARLLAWSERLDRRPVLVPIDDKSLILVEEHGDELAEGYVFSRRPAGLARDLSNKRRLYELCLEHGMPAPETTFPADEREVREIAEDAVFPIVVKRVDYFAREERRGDKMAIVHDRDELLTAFDAMRSFPEPGLMLQEYLPGGADSVWMFDGYFDASSRCLFGVTGQKLRQHPVDTGVATLAVCRDNEFVRGAAAEVLGRLGYTGIVDLGFRYDARDGRYKLLDVNPRVGCTFRLFVDSNGTDVVEAMYRDLTGQAVPVGAPVEGRRWIVENYDCVSAAALVAQRRLQLREWLRSLRGVAEGAWFALDDPLPFLGMVVSSAGAARTRALGSLRRRKATPAPIAEAAPEPPVSTLRP